MSSTIDWFDCPKCGEQVSREQDNRTCEVYYNCSNCGWCGDYLPDDYNNQKAKSEDGMEKEYWVDADGYLVYGIREKNEWETIAEIPQKHIELLAKLIYTYPDLLTALEQIKILNAGKDNDIDWLCDKAIIKTKL